MGYNYFSFCLYPSKIRIIIQGGKQRDALVQRSSEDNFWKILALKKNGRKNLWY